MRVQERARGVFRGSDVRLGRQRGDIISDSNCNLFSVGGATQGHLSSIVICFRRADQVMAGGSGGIVGADLARGGELKVESRAKACGGDAYCSAEGMVGG